MMSLEKRNIRIKELKLSGKTNSDIGLLLGLSGERIRQISVELGITKRKRRSQSRQGVHFVNTKFLGISVPSSILKAVKKIAKRDNVSVSKIVSEALYRQGYV